MLSLEALAQAYSRGGRHDEAIAAAREVVETQEKANAFVNRGDHLRHLAEAYLHAGRLDEAEAAAREALGFALRFKEGGAEGWIRWVLGEAACRRADDRAARAHVEAARAIAAELGMGPLAERCAETLSALG
jgi:tetratricopeptide (TPR) repeat protein